MDIDMCLESYSDQRGRIYNQLMDIHIALVECKLQGPDIDLDRIEKDQLVDSLH